MGLPDETTSYTEFAALPRAVRALFWVCLALAALSFILYGTGYNAYDYVNYGFLSLLTEEIVIDRSSEFIALGIAFVACAWMVVRRKRIAHIIFLITLAAFIGWLIDVSPKFVALPDYDFNNLPAWQLIPGASFVHDLGARCLYVFIGLASMWYAYTKITRAELAQWFRLKSSQPPQLTSGAVVLAFITAAFVWCVLRSVSPFGFLAISFSDFGEWSRFFTFGGFMDSYLPFILASIALIWRRDVIEDFDENGARVFFASTGWRVFNTPWRRVWRADLISRGNDPAGAVIHYRAKGWFPTSFTVNAKRGDDKFSQRIEEVLAQHNIKTTRQRVSELLPYFAWLMFALAGLCLFYFYFRQQQSWLAYSKLEWPPADFASIADPVLYGFTTLASTCLLGGGAGLLSAYHRAGTRPFLVVAYLFVLRNWQPSSILHWFVWIAVYSILMARNGQAGRESLLPPTVQQWDIGFFLDAYAVPISALVYVLAIVLVVRRDRGAIFMRREDANQQQSG